MKELTGYCMNVVGVAREGGTWEPRAELVVIASEPEYRPGLHGLDKGRRVETFRVVCDAVSLKRLAAALAEYAKDLESLCEVEAGEAGP